MDGMRNTNGSSISRFIRDLNDHIDLADISVRSFCARKKNAQKLEGYITTAKIKAREIKGNCNE